MTVTRLVPRRVEKIWGRDRLGFGFADPAPGGEPVGEIWFETPDGSQPELLVKYLFTSEKLSVQVHPDDAQARADGLGSGKEECWVVLDAEPGATLGIGLTRTATNEEVRAAALDGSIERMLDWRPVAPGDVFYLAAGTIHAIGAGVTLVEVQQYADITYRLYDYGRPRDLHLDRAMDVIRPGPWQAPSAARAAGDGRKVLAEGRKFVLERWDGEARRGLDTPGGDPVWLVPLDGAGKADGEPIEPGGVWMAKGGVGIAYKGALLVAYPGGKVAA